MISGGGKGSHQEIEARFLDVDMEKLRRDLKKMNAKKIHELRLYRRVMYNLCSKGIKGYGRVRDENGKITCTVKTYPKDSKYANEYEVMLTPGTRFEDAREFVGSLGLKEIAYHETLREKWLTKGGVEVTIDVIPGLPPYTEIEAKSVDKMKQVISKLGFDLSKATYGAYGVVYTIYYGMPDTVINKTVSELKFATVDKVLGKYCKKNKELLKKVKSDNLKLYKRAIQ
jgi:adenylate cyclase class 2